MAIERGERQGTAARSFADFVAWRRFRLRWRWWLRLSLRDSFKKFFVGRVSRRDACGLIESCEFFAEFGEFFVQMDSWHVRRCGQNPPRLLPNRRDLTRPP